MDDFISTIQISPLRLTAIRSARRPDASGNSGNVASLICRKRRWTPRRTSMAFSDCLPSERGWVWLGITMGMAHFVRGFTVKQSEIKRMRCKKPPQHAETWPKNGLIQEFSIYV